MLTISTYLGMFSPWLAQYCSISFSIVRSNSSFVYVSDGCCSAAWLVALSALWLPNEAGSFACVCEVQSGKLVPLPVRNSVEVVAVRSRFICLNHQQTIVKSAFGKGISRRSALAAIVFIRSEDATSE